jgi:hypothetical protein
MYHVIYLFHVSNGPYALSIHYIYSYSPYTLMALPHFYRRYNLIYISVWHLILLDSASPINRFQHGGHTSSCHDWKPLWCLLTIWNRAVFIHSGHMWNCMYGHWATYTSLFLLASWPVAYPLLPLLLHGCYIIYTHFWIAWNYVKHGPKHIIRTSNYAYSCF